MTPADVDRVPAGAWSIALAGAVALAVAMGFGRFAFTPLLPMMLHDGVLDLPGASWLATSNYLGYMVGALLCTLQPWLWRRRPTLPPIEPALMVRAGLIATGLLTLGMSLPVASLWPLWRFAAGVASALVFVYTSGWCLANLARRGAGALGGVIYTGPGSGIVVSGLFATGMVQWHWRAATGWAILGVLAFALTGLVWRIFVPTTPVAASASVLPDAAPAPAVRHGPREVGCLAFGYGLAGLGYIVTATFLPVIARQALPGSPWLDLFWPVFGLGTVVGALLATRIDTTRDMRGLLVAAYLLQAAGIGIGLASPSLVGFALGSLLLGLPFTAITLFAMQEVRRVRPLLVASTMGLLTAVYGLGQIAGPPLVALLLAHSPSAGAGFSRSLEVAMGALLLGAAVYGAMMRVWPMTARR